MSLGKTTDNGTHSSFSRHFELSGFDSGLHGRPLPTGCGYYSPGADGCRTVTCPVPGPSDFNPKLTGRRV